MGNYERIYNTLDRLHERKTEINKQLDELETKLEEIEGTLDEDALRNSFMEKIDTLLEELWEVNVAIGECEGGLIELRQIDGEDY